MRQGFYPLINEWSEKMFLFNCRYRAVNTGCKNNIDIRRRRAVRDQAANDKIYDLRTAALPRGVGKNEQHTLAGTDQIFKRLGINRPVKCRADLDIRKRTRSYPRCKD